MQIPQNPRIRRKQSNVLFARKNFIKKTLSAIHMAILFIVRLLNWCTMHLNRQLPLKKRLLETKILHQLSKMIFRSRLKQKKRRYQATLQKKTSMNFRNLLKIKSHLMVMQTLEKHSSIDSWVLSKRKMIKFMMQYRQIL